MASLGASMIDSNGARSTSPRIDREMVSEIGEFIAHLRASSEEWMSETTQAVNARLSEIESLRAFSQPGAESLDRRSWLLLGAILLSGQDSTLRSTTGGSYPSPEASVGSPGTACSYCEESRARLECADCKQSFCMECSSVLHLQSSKRGHTITTLNLKTEEIESDDNALKCSTHPLCEHCETALARIYCSGCEASQCEACHKVLHKAPSMRDHEANRIGGEGLEVEIHDGCARVKLPWLNLTIDITHLKAVFNYKKIRQAVQGPVCRFCTNPMSASEPAPPMSFICPALSNVCGDEECIGKRGLSCTKILQCGHPCGGVRDEETCLPCLHGCHSTSLNGDRTALCPEGEDLCRVCWTEELREGPCVQLECGHTFHMQCISTLLSTKWHGARITFGFLQCPLCRTLPL